MQKNNKSNTTKNERRKIRQKNVEKKILLSIKNSPLVDLISSKLHSDDFTQTRYSYIAIRLRLMLLFFAITVPLFSFFDFQTLPPEKAKFLLELRVILSVSLLFLAYIISQKATAFSIRLVVTLAVSTAHRLFSGMYNQF